MTNYVNNYSELYDRYAGAVYGSISRALVDEETINTVFVKAFAIIFTDIRYYSPGHSTLFTWMMGIVQQEINEAKNNSSKLLLR